MKTAAPLVAARTLGIEHPLVQGPFGGGLSTATLVETVSNLGGLGSFGAYHLPPAEIAPLVRELRSRTDRPYAINLWVSDHDRGGATLTDEEFEATYALYESSYRELGIAKPRRPSSFFQPFEDQAWALIEAAPPAFSFVFGIPSADILAACRKRHIVTIGAATSLAEAKQLEEAGVDLLVATGFEAAGHRPSFLRRAEDSLMGTFALTQLVSGHVRTPVIAAGGIVDGRGARAAFALGAQAVQLGTAFLACEESGATVQHRAALFSPLAEQTRLTRTYTGRLARGIPNRVVEQFEACGRDLPPFPIHSWFVAKLRAADAAAGRSDFLSLYASQSTPNVSHRTATGLMHSLIEAIA